MSENVWREFCFNSKSVSIYYKQRDTHPPIPNSNDEHFQPKNAPTTKHFLMQQIVIMINTAEKEQFSILFRCQSRDLCMFQLFTVPSRNVNKNSSRWVIQRGGICESQSSRIIVLFILHIWDHRVRARMSLMRGKFGKFSPTFFQTFDISFGAQRITEITVLRMGSSSKSLCCCCSPHFLFLSTAEDLVVCTNSHWSPQELNYVLIFFFFSSRRSVSFSPTTLTARSVCERCCVEKGEKLTWKYF